MMGDQPSGNQSRLSGVYGTIIIVTLALVAVGLFAGASAALTDNSADSGAIDAQVQLDTEETIVENVQTQTLAQPEGEEDDENVYGEGNVQIEDDGIFSEGTEFNLSVLTSQVGDVTVESEDGSQEIAIVHEQSIAMQDEWGSYTPVSHTVEHAGEHTDLITRSSGHELRSQSWTSIGDLLGIGFEVSDIYDYGCAVDSSYIWSWAPWDEEYRAWCGWHSDAGEDGTLPNSQEIYHVDADTSLTPFFDWDIDTDNIVYDEHVPAYDADGILENPGDSMMELPTYTNPFYEGLWDWTSDEEDSDNFDLNAKDISDGDSWPDFDVKMDYEDLYYIEYSMSEDVWGFDTQSADETWLRVEYDHLFTDTDATAPADPMGERYHAMQTVAEIIADDDGEFGVYGDGQAHLEVGPFAPGEDLEDLYTGFGDRWDDEDYEESHYTYWNFEQSFEQAVDDVGEDGTIVLVTTGQHAMHPPDEWYEHLGESIPLIFDDITADRPDREDAIEGLDQEFVEMAEDADAEIRTLAVGEASDGYRLAKTADAANSGTDCLETGGDCDFLNTAAEPGDIEEQLIDLVFGDVTYEIDRVPVDVGAEISEDEHTILEEVNTPEEFRTKSQDPDHDHAYDGFDDVLPAEEIALLLDIYEGDGYELSATDERELGEDETADSIKYEHNRYDEMGDHSLTLGDHEDFLYFTDGADVEDLNDIPTPAWTMDPADVIEHYPEHVTDGQLDLVDPIEGTETVLVGIPVGMDDYEQDEEGYVLVALEMDMAADTDFHVDIVDENDQYDANISEETGDEWVELDNLAGGVIAGDTMEIPVNVTNYGIEGEEHITLKATGGVDETTIETERITLDEDESTTQTFTWKTDDDDVGTEEIVVESHRHSDSADVNVFDPDMDVFVDIVDDNNWDEMFSYVDNDHVEPDRVNITEKIDEDEEVMIPVNVSNQGWGDGEVTVGLSAGEDLRTNSTELEAHTEEDSSKTVWLPWEPSFADLEELRIDDSGESVHDTVELTAEVSMPDDNDGQVTDTATMPVEYLPAMIEIDLDDDPETVDPVDIDVDEIEIES